MFNQQAVRRFKAVAQVEQVGEGYGEGEEPLQDQTGSPKWIKKQLLASWFISRSSVYNLAWFMMLILAKQSGHEYIDESVYSLQTKSHRVYQPLIWFSNIKDYTWSNEQH